MHENLDAVGDERGQATLRQLCATRIHDDRGANVVDGDDRRKDEQHHDGTVECDQLLGVREVLAHVLRGGTELGRLMLLGDERLHHADSGDVLLHRVVQHIVLLENTAENREGNQHNDGQDDCEQRHHAEEDQRHLGVDPPGHDDRENDHEGHAHCDADQHTEGVLNVRHVRRHAGDQRGRGETVYIGEGEVLHLEEQIMTQILGQAHRCGRREAGGENAARERGEGQAYEDQPQSQDGAEGHAVKRIHERHHDQRDQTLEDHLTDDEQRGEDRGSLKLAQPPHQRSNGFHESPLRFIRTSYGRGRGTLNAHAACRW